MIVSIANARGVPGALGALVRDSGGSLGFVTCHHVLFGGGARAGDPVWAVHEGRGGRTFAEIGVALRGQIGRVTSAEGATCFVDCAVGALHAAHRLPPFVREALEAYECGGAADAQVGTIVCKRGWITGHTRGVVADTQHYERPWIDGRGYEAPGQILVRPDDPDASFSAPGESGAAVVDGAGRIVGFVWGTNPSGEAIAFPALPALRHLEVAPATGWTP